MPVFITAVLVSMAMPLREVLATVCPTAGLTCRAVLNSKAVLGARAI